MPILERETSVFPETLFEDAEFELNNPHRRWWAIFTKARNEKAFARDLLRFEIPYYLPMVPKKNLIRKRVVHSHIPLFGGYVFMFGDEDDRLQALTSNRISVTLNVDDQQQLRHDLNQLHRLIKLGAPLTIEERLCPGRSVRIKTGAFSGVEGVITQRRGGRRRLLVAVHFLQTGVSLEVDDFNVEPI